MEQPKLLFENSDALRERDAKEIRQGGDEAARDLWRTGAGHPDLIERQVNVVLPAHGFHEQAEFAGLVTDMTVGERPACELSEDVVQPVDRLHGGRRVLERRLRQ